MQTKEYSIDFCGKPLKVEISDLADQANGSVLVRYGDTAVFATAVMSHNRREGLDYFPLTVDYEERFYAAGMILGSRFIRREGRPTEEAILTSRLIDRTIRPLFNIKIRNEVQVIVLALSVDNKNDPDIPAIIAASLALGISDIPWGGPIGAVRMGYVDNNFIANPIYEEREKSLIDIVICGKDRKINMTEAGAKEAHEDIIGEAMERGLEEIANIQEFQEKIIKEIGKEKAEIEIKEEMSEMKDFFKKEILKKLHQAIYSGEKHALNDLKHEWMDLAKEKFGEENSDLAADLYEENINEIIHNEILDSPAGKEKRPDARKIDELRSLYANVRILPLIHGSGIFFRGGTHIFSAVTLGGPKEGQLIEGMEIQTTKHFLHHYNFPPFSTGETGRIGGTGRREIGHGALAERALSAVIPSREEFPYTIRVVSESMASNGSTSMGSVCASTLALMDAGVPIKNPVAGIAMGLMMRDEKNYKVLTDIQGPEDHHGDMDFKCAGTKEGVTAIQMDVKVEGVTVEILKKALRQARKAREEILEVIKKAMPAPRQDLPTNAPKIVKIYIDPDKIGAVIGPGGKMINSIIEKTNTEIDIDQDGTVFITGKDLKEIAKARDIIEGLTHEFKIGEIVTGKVTRLFDFGAMVGVGGDQEGLVHISELSPERVEKVTDVVNAGDEVTAQVISIDERGRINLSIKRVNPDYDPSKDLRNNNRNNNDAGRGKKFTNRGGRREAGRRR
ncbi:polyribonucleotide nucleotidyltransferase [Patescibacteria group bacterium]|nr:polyribonucleotide nucleotidyltransferase [Patescibacteria group bacterium]MBU2263547.1 polyribonucleotide nucleotidyltransferase [Patescibacteria group bacterium]